MRLTRQLALTPAQGGCFGRPARSILPAPTVDVQASQHQNRVIRSGPRQKRCPRQHFGSLVPLLASLPVQPLSGFGYLPAN